MSSGGSTPGPPFWSLCGASAMLIEPPFDLSFIKDGCMNKSWVLSAFIVSMNAMAASIPSNLPDGKYTMDCQNISVVKYDPPAPGSTDNPVPEGTDSNGITRKVQYQTGTSIYITSGDTTTIKEVYSVRSDDFSGSGEDLTQKVVKSVGDNQFEESETVTNTFTIPDTGDIKGQTSSDTYSWKRTFAVQGNFEVSLKTKNGDDPEVPGHSEALVTKNSDGSYTIVSYIREGFHQDRENLKDGAYVPAKYLYQTDSICKYTPAK
jgi:hypothetical protein